jgi:hypothetical protein
MKKTILVLLAVLAVLLVSGCSINYGTANGKLSYGDMPGKATSEFSAKGRLTYILHPSLLTLGNKTNEELDDLIEPAISEAGGRGATNITITHGFDFLSLIIRYVTGGVLNMDYIEVSGQVVK